MTRYGTDPKHEIPKGRRLGRPISKTLQIGFLDIYVVQMHGSVLLVIGTLLPVGILVPYSLFIITLMFRSAVISLTYAALLLQRRYASRLLSHLPEEEKTRS